MIFVELVVPVVVEIYLELETATPVPEEGSESAKSSMPCATEFDPVGIVAGCAGKGLMAPASGNALGCKTVAGCGARTVV